jgi:hypothetical protein
MESSPYSFQIFSGTPLNSGVSMLQSLDETQDVVVELWPLDCAIRYEDNIDEM